MNALAKRSMSTEFCEWQDLSDAYVAGIEALRRKQPGAAIELMRISRALQTCQGAADQRHNSAQ